MIFQTLEPLYYHDFGKLKNPISIELTRNMQLPLSTIDYLLQTLFQFLALDFYLVQTFVLVLTFSFVCILHMLDFSSYSCNTFIDCIFPSHFFVAFFCRLFHLLELGIISSVFVFHCNGSTPDYVIFFKFIFLGDNPCIPSHCV